MTDTRPEPPETTLRFQPVAELVHALGFLTRLPIPFIRTIAPPPLAQSMRLFSVAGALIGLALGLFLVALRFMNVPDMMAGVLTVAAGLVITGGLHEDGLADMADGFGGGKTHEQRLAIMRDSRIGSYGALALGIALLARVAAYSSLYAMPSYAAIGAIVAAQSFSRAMVVGLLWATRPARQDGLSASVGRPSRNAAVFAIVVGLSIALATGTVMRPEGGIIALGLALAATAQLRRMAVRHIGGQTGDVCGAVQVCSEVMMLVAFVATNH